MSSCRATNANHDHATKRTERVSTRCTDRSASESRTRTCDPVINSHLSRAAFAAVPPLECADSVLELRGLAKAAARLAAPDALDVWLAAGGEL